MAVILAVEHRVLKELLAQRVVMQSIEKQAVSISRCWILIRSECFLIGLVCKPVVKTCISLAYRLITEAF